MTEANAILRGAEYWQRHPGRAALVIEKMKQVIEAQKSYIAARSAARGYLKRHADGFLSILIGEEEAEQTFRNKI